MLNAVAIFFGGGLGCLIRYAATLLLKMNSFYFPLATFCVNILGSFILGVIMAIFMRQPELNPTLRLAIGVGFCGGLTTFSTFSLESFELIKNGEILQALIYIFSSVILCVFAVFMGVVISKYV